MELARRCGRPFPEVKGVKLERPEDSELSRRVVAPVSEEFTVDVMERTWIDGMIWVM
jgi:hypothetical protein